MAVTFNTTALTRETTQWAALPENILIDPELNGRHEHTDVSALAADILANGQHSPCLIRKNADGLPVLVYGHRRWRAIQYINEHLLQPGQPKVEVLCNYEKLTDEQAFHAAITENHQRVDVNDMDHCHNINVWRKRFHKSLEAIAQIYFPEAKSAKEKADALRWVQDRADLAELAPEAAQAVREGAVKITAAVELAKLTENQQRQVVAEGKSKVAGKTRIKVSDVKAVKAATAKGKTAPVQAAAPVLTPAKTIKIIKAAEDLACAVDNWLEDATDEDKAEKRISETLTVYRKLVPVSFPQAGDRAA